MDVNYLKVGDLVMVTQDGVDRLFEVFHLNPAGSAGRRFSAGQTVLAKLVGGKGYTVYFDNDTTHLKWRTPTAAEIGEVIGSNLSKLDAQLAEIKAS